MRQIRVIALMAAAGALAAALPASGEAHHKNGHDHGGGHARGGKCVVNKGFAVRGALVSYRADDTSTTSTNEQSVTLTVTRMNRHARRAGLADADTAAQGTQYRIDAGGANGDPFRVRLVGYEPNEDPAAGDRVRVIGKVAVTKRRCVPSASVEDRYGAVDVRRVRIADRD
jgi:hypothetical protein